MIKDFDVYYNYKGERHRCKVSVETDFIPNYMNLGYVVWREAIQSLQDMHDMTYVTRIEICLAER